MVGAAEQSNVPDEWGVTALRRSAWRKCWPKRGHKGSLREACLFEERVGSQGQAEAKPSEVAKASGTPNSLIVTRSAVRERAITSDLLYWKGGLKVLHQAQLPKWRASFQWQIEAKIEALQTAYATLRAEGAGEGG